MNRELWDGLGVNVYITREEVPPTLFFFGEKLDGHRVSQSSRPVAPCRELEGGRRSGLTPPKKLLVVEERGEVVKPSEEELGGVGGAEGEEEGMGEGHTCP